MQKMRKSYFKNSCPVYNKNCQICQKLNYLANVCRFKKKINILRIYYTNDLIPRSQNDDSNEYVLRDIKNNESKNKQE